MRRLARINLSRLMMLAAFASSVLLATPVVAQRYQEDEFPAEKSGSEPPRLMRGGFMQQLRSVTESVIGSPEERTVNNTEPHSRVPTPPPLGTQRRSPDMRMHQDDRDSSQGPRNGDGRSWAGQFLIPNYRLRDQAGPPHTGAPHAGSAPGNAARSANPPRQPMRSTPSDSVNLMFNDEPESPVPAPSNARGSVPTPRVYLGQRTPVRNELSDREEDVERQSEPSKAAPVAKRFAQVPQPPRPGESVVAQLSDSRQAAVSDSEAKPVVVSQVPDIPYVPRKPLPNRGGSSAAEPTVKLPITPSAVQAAPLSNSQQPPHPLPKSPSSTGSASALPSDPPTPSVPSIPSLELSKSPSTRSDVGGGTNDLAARPSFPSNQRSLSEPPALPQSPPAFSPPAVSPPAVSPPAVSPPAVAALPSAPRSMSPSLADALSTVPSLPNHPSLPSSDSGLAPVPRKLPAQTVSSPVSPPTQLPTSQLPTSQLPGLPTSIPVPPSNSSSAASDLPASGRPRMHMEIPHVEVKLLGPGDLTAGTPTDYEIQVQNNGRIPLSGLILRMETPAGAQIVPRAAQPDAVEIETGDDGACILTWQVDQVAAGGQARLPLQINAHAARNFAVAIEWTVLPQAGVEEIVVRQADLQVALEGPVQVERTASNAYRVKVSNPGSATARQVRVRVNTATQLNSQIDVGDLAPGQTEIIDMDLTFEKAGQVDIGVEAVAERELLRTANIKVTVQQPILTASLTLPESVLFGAPLVASAQLSNSGDASARNVQVGMALPVGTKLGQIPAGLSYQADKLLWDVSQLAPGQTVTVPVELILVSPGAHEITLAAVSADGTTATTKSQTMVEAFADLKLRVNDPTSPSPVGAPVTYELSITNRGSRDAHGVVVLAQFSDGIEPESATGLGNRIVPGQVIFETLPIIAAGQTVNLKVVARAAKAGVHRFRAEVRCDESEARLVEEESTRFIETAGRIATQPGTAVVR